MGVHIRVQLGLRGSTNKKRVGNTRIKRTINGKRNIRMDEGNRIA